MEVKSFYGKKFHRLGSALDSLAASTSTNPVNLVIVPPDPDTQTDEEDVDDDVTSDHSQKLPVDIPGTVEIEVTEEDFEETDREESESVPVRKRRCRTATGDIRWKKVNPEFNMPPATSGAAERRNQAILDLVNLEPVDVFQQIFDDEVFGHIVEQSNLYAAKNNCHTFSVTADELRAFFGILFFSGYHSLPQQTHYWSLDEDLSVPCIGRT